MSKIGVAVPTKDRSGLLRETLICLKEQTASDFEVLVLDNASSDDTPQVFETTVGSDRRFRYQRQPSPVPVLRNFLDALAAVDSPYFLWRADDDLSAPDYLEKLARRLDAEPQADLAISPFKRWHSDTGQTTFMPLPDYPSADPVDRAIHLLRNKRPTWIYGMWRRERLIANVGRVGKRYTQAWAWDHLQMMPSVLAGRVAIEQDTWFVQRIMGRGAYELATGPRLEARLLYADVSNDLLSDIPVPPARLPELRAAMEFHFDDRVGPLKRLKRRRVKERLLAAIGLKRH